jgi:hypothetical protein
MYICKHSTHDRDTKINTIITSQSFVNTDTNNTRKHAEKHYLIFKSIVSLLLRQVVFV